MCLILLSSTLSRYSVVLLLALVFVSLAPTRVKAERQGGDTIELAVPITSLPYDDSGTTVGFANDYDESCPYPGVSPDVVYEFIPEHDLLLTVDLWGSDYDTKVWIWDANLSLVVCNDDYYWENYESKIVAAPLLGGAVYYIVVDGHTNDQGNYVMHIQEYEACDIPCPGDAELEGEPTLFDGYIDELNGGCTSIDFLGYAPYQPITSPVFFAVSGWYDSPGPIDWDIDWFEFVIPQDGYLNISIETEMLLRVYESNPQDCDNIWYGNQIVVAGCSERTMTVFGEPGDLVWILVRPSFEPPWYFEGIEFDYVLRSNLESQLSSTDTPKPLGSLSVHPNPFNPRTTISFSIGHPQNVELCIFDMTGKRIAVLADREFQAGAHTVDWQGKDLHGLAVASGTYLVQLSTDGRVTSDKMMLVR